MSRELQKANRKSLKSLLKLLKKCGPVIFIPMSVIQRLEWFPFWQSVDSYHFIISCLKCVYIRFIVIMNNIAGITNQNFSPPYRTSGMIFQFVCVAVSVVVLRGGGHSGSMFSPVSPGSLLLSNKWQMFPHSPFKGFYADSFIYQWLVFNIAYFLTCVGCDTVHVCQCHAQSWIVRKIVNVVINSAEWSAVSPEVVMEHLCIWLNSVCFQLGNLFSRVFAVSPSFVPATSNTINLILPEGCLSILPSYLTLSQVFRAQSEVWVVLPSKWWLLEAVEDHKCQLLLRCGHSNRVHPACLLEGHHLVWWDHLLAWWVSNADTSSLHL